MVKFKEIYVSTDIEADGPIPGENSLLSLASAAFSADGKLISTFTANLETLPNANPDPETMKWWETQAEAWQSCRTDTQTPELAMQTYNQWLRNLPKKPVFVGYPAAYDFMFVYWYLIKFTGNSPFSHSALDIKTLAMALMKTDFRSASKRRMPADWFGEHKHSHVALDDAIEQGELFCNMLKQLHT